jgi:putative addiction module killer protein
MALTVVEYVREDGSNPFRNWFDGLDPRAAAKVASATLRLEAGNISRVKWIGTIGEYRIDWGPGYRIYLATDGNALIVLFGGGTKKRQQGDIRRAEALFTEYKARKAAATGSRGKR